MVRPICVPLLKPECREERQETREEMEATAVETEELQIQDLEAPEEATEAVVTEDRVAMVWVLDQAVLVVRKAKGEAAVQAAVEVRLQII